MCYVKYVGSKYHLGLESPGYTRSFIGSLVVKFNQAPTTPTDIANQQTQHENCRRCGSVLVSCRWIQADIIHHAVYPNLNCLLTGSYQAIPIVASVTVSCIGLLHLRGISCTLHDILGWPSWFIVHVLCSHRDHMHWCSFSCGWDKDRRIRPDQIPWFVHHHSQTPVVLVLESRCPWAKHAGSVQR